MQESIKADTMIEEAMLTLRKWFLAAFLAMSDKWDVSVIRLQAELGIIYDSANYLLLRIRAAMATNVSG